MPVVFALDAGPMTTDPAIIESTWSILVTCIVTGRNWCKPPRSAIRGSLQEPKKKTVFFAMIVPMSGRLKYSSAGLGSKARAR